MTISQPAGALFGTAQANVPKAARLTRGVALPAEPLARARQLLTWGLGLIWLLDAVLQYQSYMFTTAFPEEVIAPTGQGSPLWIQAPVTWSAHLMEHHIVVWNALFATVQLAIALGLFWRPTLKLALAGSVVWSVLVWWLGEGLGGLFAGPVMPIMGLPGAVIIYAFIALLVWPRAAGTGALAAGTADGSAGTSALNVGTADAPAAQSVATASPLGAFGSRLVWLVLWALFVFEGLRSDNRSSSMLHDMVSGMADGEPSWLKSINHWTATQLGHHGSVISIALVIVFAALAVGVYVPAVVRPVLVVGIAVCLLFWVCAEDIGGIATGQATDPNSGLPLALLLLCFWPVSRSGRTRTGQPATADDATTTAGLDAR